LLELRVRRKMLKTWIKLKSDFFSYFPLVVISYNTNLGV
jgi:hypothetical protein